MNEEKKCEISEKLIKLSSNNDNSNYKNTIKDLLLNGANINYQDKNGDTALMLSFGFPEKSKFLLEKGANPNIQSNEGHTALHYFAGHLTSPLSVEYLLSSNADINIKNNDKLSGLDIISKNVYFLENKHFIKLLEEKIYKDYENECVNQAKLFEIWKKVIEQNNCLVFTVDIEYKILRSLMAEAYKLLDENLKKIKLTVDNNKINKIEKTIKNQIRKEYQNLKHELQQEKELVSNFEELPFHNLIITEEPRKKEEIKKYIEINSMDLPANKSSTVENIKVIFI